MHTVGGDTHRITGIQVPTECWTLTFDLLLEADRRIKSYKDWSQPVAYSPTNRHKNFSKDRPVKYPLISQTEKELRKGWISLE